MEETTSKYGCWGRYRVQGQKLVGLPRPFTMYRQKNKSWKCDQPYPEEKVFPVAAWCDCRQTQKECGRVSAWVSEWVSEWVCEKEKLNGSMPTHHPSTHATTDPPRTHQMSQNSSTEKWILEVRISVCALALFVCYSGDVGVGVSVSVGGDLGVGGHISARRVVSGVKEKVWRLG